MNLFDQLQVNAFNVVSATMGYPATWQPSTGGEEQTAQVLYRGPTDEEKLAGVDYKRDELTMEYKEGDFPGLKELADTNKREIVTITTDKGNLIVMVMAVIKKFDGKTYVATVRVKAFRDFILTDEFGNQITTEEGKAITV